MPETDRRSIHDWDDPSRDLSRYRWYNPVLWYWFGVEIVILARWLVWHKRQSWGADRTAVHTEVVMCLQTVGHLRRSENLEPGQQQQLDRIEDGFERVADEMNLQSEHLDRYRTDGESDE